MVLSEAVRDFGLSSRHEVGHTKKTHLSYQHRQRHFLNWLAEQGHPDPDVDEITPTLIRRYSYSLSARKLRPRTIRGAMGALGALFVYLVRMGAIGEHATPEVALPKLQAAVGEADARWSRRSNSRLKPRPRLRGGRGSSRSPMPRSGRRSRMRVSSS